VPLELSDIERSELEKTGAATQDGASIDGARASFLLTADDLTT
jgi:hypothetical protein